jgi:hypothetical protein
MKKIDNLQNQDDLQIVLVAKTTGFEGQTGNGRGKQFGSLPNFSYFYKGSPVSAVSINAVYKIALNVGIPQFSAVFPPKK